MSAELLIGACLIVFATHVVGAMTGFGSTVLALPFVALLAGLRTTVPTLILLAWLSSLLVVLLGRRHAEAGHVVRIVGWCAPGLVAGFLLFQRLPEAPLRLVLGLYVIGVAAQQIVTRNRANARPATADPADPADPADGTNPENVPYMEQAPGGEAAPGKAEDGAAGKAEPAPERSRAPDWAYLLGGGAFHGAFGTGGPLLILYASRAIPRKEVFRVTLCIVWLLLNSAMIAGYVLEGTLTEEVWTLAGACLPGLLLSVVVGQSLHVRVTARTFRNVIFAVLGLSGAALLWG